MILPMAHISQRWVGVRHINASPCDCILTTKTFRAHIIPNPENHFTAYISELLFEQPQSGSLEVTFLTWHGCIKIVFYCSGAEILHKARWSRARGAACVTALHVFEWGAESQKADLLRIYIARAISPLLQFET